MIKIDNFERVLLLVMGTCVGYLYGAQEKPQKYVYLHVEDRCLEIARKEIPPQVEMLPIEVYPPWGEYDQYYQTLEEQTYPKDLDDYVKRLQESVTIIPTGD